MREERALAPLAERDLGTTEAVAQALAIGPVVSVGFATYLAAGTAGGATPLAVLIAFAGAAAFGWTLTVFARRYAGAGGIYEFLVSAAPPFAAVMFGGLYFLQGLITAVAALVGGLVAQGFCTTHLGFDPGWVAPGLAIAAIAGGLTLRGIRIATRWLLALTVLGAMPLVILTLAALGGAGAQGISLRPFDPGGGDVLAAIPYAVLLFLGFEAAVCLGEESRAPRASIPRAIPIGIAACGLFYVVTIYAITLGIGTDSVAERWGADPLAPVGLADQIVGRPLGALVHAGVLIDIVALAIANTNAASRGWLALARDDLAPRWLASISPWGTPLGGTLLLVGANVVLVIAGVLDDEPFHVFEAAFTAGPIVVLGVYLVLCGLAARILAREDGPAWRWIVLAIGFTVPVLGYYGTLEPWPDGPREAGLYLAAALVTVAVAWALWRRPVR